MGKMILSNYLCLPWVNAKDHVWVHGITTVQFYADVWACVVTKRPSGCLWSGLLPEAKFDVPTLC